MNKDVFLAILSVDSYGRGYNQGVKGLSDTGGIGNSRDTIPIPFTQGIQGGLKGDYGDRCDNP